MVVAGGAGFLGSHLCERLLRRGHCVLCIDDLSTGAMTNIEGLMEEPGFRLTLHDIAETLEIEEPIGIFNLACPASPVHYQADPVRTTMTSVQGTYNLLELARRESRGWPPPHRRMRARKCARKWARACGSALQVPG
jgi:UDP-glucuronate decarboxylase